MTSPTATAGRQLAVAVVVFVLALLLAEGLLSLVAERSLAELVGRARASVPAALDRNWNASRDADRILAAARNPGHYRLHDDPRVGFVHKAEAELEIEGALARTDALGMRRRPAGPGPEEALRIVVLGDSVAFGFGVGDEQTLAHQLERQLTAARPADARPVVARTVAVPGWNQQAAVHFLLDHLDRYAPDLVVYVPVNNDLSDGYGVYESGHRQFLQHGFVPGASDPWLPVNADRTLAAALELVRVARQEGRAPPDVLAALGPLALSADLSRESTRRYDANLASLALLADVLAGQDARLVLAPYGADPYFAHLFARVARELPELPVVPLFARIDPAFSLPTDPHPNPTAQGVMATWIARGLLEPGLVAGDPSRLPEVPPLYTEARAVERDAEAWQAEADKARRGALGLLVPGVAPRQARGLFQVYGGLNADGSMGPSLLAVLPRRSARIRAQLSPLPDRPDLLPVAVTLSVDGQELVRGTLVDGPVTLEAALPPGAEPVEVAVTLDRAVVVELDGRATLAGARLTRLSTAP